MDSLSDFICCSKCESVLTRDDLENGKCPDCGNDTFVDAHTFLSSNIKSYVSPTQPSHPTLQNTPKCPTCGSTNVEKISTAKKAFGFAMVGLFSSNLGKTMECRNCGYKW